MMMMRVNHSPSSRIALLLLIACVVSSLLELTHAIATPFDVPYPTEITLKTAVLTNTVPLAYYDDGYDVSEETELFPAYRGFQPDLMRQIVKIAKDFDNVTLNWELEQAPAFSYSAQFKLMANDCIGMFDEKKNITYTEEDCNRLDLVIGDYYGYPSRSIRTLFTPPLLTTAASSVQYVGRKQRQITTLLEAEALGEPVCLLDASHYDDQANERFPQLKELRCYTHEECIDFLKEEKCAVFVEDELQLRYLMVQDADLLVTPEKFDEQYIVWPLNARLEPLKQQLIIRWIYEAKVSGYLDSLYDKYFRINFCPLGKAGEDCDKPCSTAHGVSDRYGTCVCESTRWTGDDCSVEVKENMHLLPTSLKAMCYTMVAINFTVVAACAIWLFLFREASPVKAAQPLFLGLVLLGCLLSTSTIFALVQEDDGSNGHGEANVPACMAIPWLYSVGFSVTFGSLFAKILRVYRLFRAAATMTRTVVTTKDTFTIIAGVLFVDVFLLTIWSVVDPLEWHRHFLTEDKFGNPLSSEGYCVSDHWAIFAGLIAAFHLLLMGVACWMCYRARDIPTEFSEGKYVTIAMISNLQIFVVGVPVLIILGADSQTSIFVRSVVIFMNDLVVVTLIFGNLFNIVHLENRIKDNSKQLIREAMDTYKENKVRRESTMQEASAGLQALSRFSIASSLNSSNHSRGSIRQRPSVFGSRTHTDAVEVLPTRKTSATMNSSVMDNSDGLANSNRSASSQRRMALMDIENCVEPPTKRYSDPDVMLETLMEVSQRHELSASFRPEDRESTRSPNNNKNASEDQEERLDVIKDESSIGELTMSESTVQDGKPGGSSTLEFGEESVLVGNMDVVNEKGNGGDVGAGDGAAVVPPSVTQ